MPFQKTFGVHIYMVLLLFLIGMKGFFEIKAFYSLVPLRDALTDVQMKKDDNLYKFLEPGFEGVIPFLGIVSFFYYFEGKG